MTHNTLIWSQNAGNAIPRTAIVKLFSGRMRSEPPTGNHLRQFISEPPSLKPVYVIRFLGEERGLFTVNDLNQRDLAQ